MSSYDKVVKLACKPKAAPPKAKYIDPIIAATWADDGAVHDVCKALSPRIREPNTIVVFKALIVLHTMIRNGATDNVLSYLSSSDILKLRNVAAGNWEGYAAPQNLQNYALYLDSRIRAYKDLKHDAVRVQAESNRDMRNSTSIEEDGYRGRKDRPTKPIASAPTRSKTIMGRKLRSMAVEKGLLRETKAVHNMIDALVECRFYLDDLEDELTVTALRMLVKDLLILFQAGNEGVINVLEHYFEMSHVDAEEALRIYRHFCKQTEYVVEFLGVAKKLQNLLNVPIPNLKHAPVSLAGALQEYMDDPNFEQNRIEYKTNKDAVERGGKTNSKKAASSKSTDKSSSATSPKLSSTGPSKDAASSSSSKPANGNAAVLDFFSSIDEGQPTMFNPQTNSPSTAYFQQQGAANPFSQMLTGQQQPFMQQQPQIALQQTGFLLPQATAMPQQPNPFGNFLAPQQTGHRPFSSYLPAQPSGFPQQMPQQMQMTNSLPMPQQQQQFLQPQMTGANPFRQSMLVPQTTGMQLFGGVNQGQMMPGTGIPQNQTSFTLSSPSFIQQGPTSATGFAAPKPSFGTNNTNGTPARPASTPLTSSNAASSPGLQPVKTHQTGTKNPFGPISNAAPPVPKAPTLLELSSGVFNPNQNQGQTNQQQTNQFGSQQQPQQQQQQPTGANGFSFANSALNPGASDISSIASSFAFSNKPAGSFNNTAPLTSQNTSATNNTTTSGSTFSDSYFSSSVSSQPTGTTNTSSSPSTQASSIAPVKSHLTGFSGLKAFKPSSSFGASLMESLPPIPGSGPTTPAITGLSNFNNNANGSGAPSTTTPSFLSSPPPSSTLGQSNNYNFLNNQPTGATGGFGGTPGGAGGTFGSSTLGVGLRPQMTGGGSANPFRASTAGIQPNMNGNGMLPGLNFGGSGFQASMPTGMGGAQQSFGGVGGSLFGAQNQQQQQPNGSSSLI